MMSQLCRLLACAALFGCRAGSASAVELFSDNFNADTSGMWTTNLAPAANAGTQQATFAYNYSVMGIPPAPGSVDTLGLRLRANLPIVGGVEVTTRPAGVLSGLSLSPTGKNFGANYQLSFHAWSNYFGAANGSGLADTNGSEGGTANALFAIGTAGTVPLVVGQPGLAGGAQMDGIGFAATTDGAVALDYRMYPKSGTPSPAGTGIYAAEATVDPGNLSPLAAEHTFYAPLFPSQSAPAVQLDLSAAEFADANNTQLGTTLAGTFGFAWHKVVISKDGASVTWDIDDERIATFNASALTLGGNNIAIGVSDVNGTTARHPSLTFTVFDNLVVTDLPGALPGDFNDSGTVDAADLAQWQADFGANAESDADGDGDSDGLDFLAWQKNLGNTGAVGATAAVAEPATQAIAALGTLAVAGWRRQARLR